MHLNIDVAMDYEIAPQDAVLLTVEVAETSGQSILSSDLAIENAALHRVASKGADGRMVWALPQDTHLKLRYRASVDVTRPDIALESLSATPAHKLPGEALIALRPSRYCQSDLFADFANQNFAHLDGGAKIAAISQWVTANMSYVPGSSNAGTTAVETFASGQGVCRDYVHVMCALARASGIPARYVAAYGLGVQPQDFHAVAQVWLGGGWQLVDPTGMSTASTLAVIGAGRDAGDVAFMETAKFAQMISQSVEVSRV